MSTATKVTTMLDWAQEAGMDTGIVTTARLTHATPAALYAHTYDRYYECDVEYEYHPTAPPAGVHDIAWQLVNTAPGNRTKVLLGGGYPAFYPQSSADSMRNQVCMI